LSNYHYDQSNIEFRSVKEKGGGTTTEKFLFSIFGVPATPRVVTT